MYNQYLTNYTFDDGLELTRGFDEATRVESCRGWRWNRNLRVCVGSIKKSGNDTESKHWPQIPLALVSQLKISLAITQRIGYCYKRE